MNIREPVTAVRANAAQVHLKMSDATRWNGRCAEAAPNNRRSITRMVPKTSANPSTWVDSSNGNSNSESRILAARAVAASHFRNVSIRPAFLQALVAGDQEP